MFHKLSESEDFTKLREVYVQAAGIWVLTDVPAAKTADAKRRLTKCFNCDTEIIEYESRAVRKYCSQKCFLEFKRILREDKYGQVR